MGLTPQFDQELWAKEQVFTRSIEAKLWESGRYDLALPLKECHTRATFCHCLACGHEVKFFNRCDRFYCPMCVSKLCYRRRKSIEAWSHEIKQPKHIVLTARNRRSLSREYVRWFKISLGKLRRRKVAIGWRGGLASLEVTNEGKGWHLHSHLLVDTDWVDTRQLSITWGQLVSQDYAIVAVKDAREKGYLQEVTKYAVKGSALAAWSATEISEFVDAFTGVRQFGCFGTLFRDRAARARILAQLDPGKCHCPACESERLAYMSEAEHDWFEETGQWTPPCYTGRR